MATSFSNEVIDWKSVVLVGEFTTNIGPFRDDYFLVVVFRSGEIGEWPLAETGALVPNLEKSIGVKVDFGLSNVTTLASRVIFPAKLAGHSLFEFCPTSKESRTLPTGLRFLGVKEISKKYTDEVEAYLRSLSKDTPASY